jgi:hypothetical protein
MEIQSYEFKNKKIHARYTKTEIEDSRFVFFF